MEMKAPGRLVPHPPSKLLPGYKHLPLQPVCTWGSQFRMMRPDSPQRSSGQSSPTSDINSPKIGTAKTPSDRCKDNLVYDTLLQPLPYSAIAKVQMPYKTRYRQIPRGLMIERCRREFLTIDFEQLLAEKGIDSSLLMPRQRKNNEPVASPFLPLEFFDNEDYDCRTPEEWLTLGSGDESPDQKFIPGKALLPDNENDQESSFLKYSWHLVGVLDYRKDTHQYLVQKVKQSSEQRDKDGNPVIVKKKKKEVKSLQGACVWIPRIRLFFTAENPRVFAERIVFAVRLRKDAEVRLIYDLSVDLMPIWEGNPSLSDDGLQRIRRLVLSSPGLKKQMVETRLGDLEKKVILEYNRVTNKFIFNDVVKSYPEDFSHITIPKEDAKYVPEKGFVPVPAFDYHRKQNAFRVKFLLRLPAVVSAVTKICSECNRVANMTLFNVKYTQPLQLSDFESIQSDIHKPMSLYLRNEWTVTMKNILHSNLSTLEKGSYNVDESSWESYRFSRLYNLMNMVLQRMQDSLRFLVQRSLVSLTKFVQEACDSVLTCNRGMVWGEDLISSPYKSQRNPIFHVDLVLDQTGIHYSSSPKDFETSVLRLFNEGIQSTYKVPNLVKLTMENLPEGCLRGIDNLKSVNLFEAEICELREKVRNALVQAAIPLRAYAAEYEKHQELFNFDIESLLKSRSGEQTPQEVKEEVEPHLKEKERLENSLPSSIVIGPFFVNVATVRETLTGKKQAIASALLDNFALKLRRKIEKECETCNTIFRRLGEKPDSIEELTEKSDWMTQIPEQLKGYTESIIRILSEYDVLDDFFHCPSEEDAMTRFTAITWPRKIIREIETTTKQQTEATELFHKVQLSDQEKFAENLNYLQAVTAGFMKTADIDFAQKTTNNVLRAWTMLKKCQPMAQTYNIRQHLLGLPVLNYDCLQKLEEDLHGFRDLWITTTNWLQWSPNWLNGLLSNIDPEQLEQDVTDALKIMRKSVELFKDIPEIKLMATEICTKIEDFCPHVALIQGLQKLGTKSYIWQMLSDRIHMKVGYKVKLTLSQCLELGLQNHVDDIDHVAKTAAIEQALENMEHEMSEIVLEVLPCRETESFVLKVPDGAFQLLDEQIARTQTMSSSPFKSILEDRIDSWEKTLRMTQGVMGDWLLCQQSWLRLKDVFSSEEISQPLLLTYLQTKQQWNGIMKTALDSPKMMKLCSDADVLDKLKQCIKAFEKIQKSLSE